MMVAGNFVYFKNIFQIHKVCAHLRWWWPNDDDDGARSCTMMTMVVADDDEDDDDVDHEHGSVSPWCNSLFGPDSRSGRRFDS